MNSGLVQRIITREVLSSTTGPIANHMLIGLSTVMRGRRLTPLSNTNNRITNISGNINSNINTNINQNSIKSLISPSMNSLSQHLNLNNIKNNYLGYNQFSNKSSLGLRLYSSSNNTEQKNDSTTTTTPSSTTTTTTTPQTPAPKETFMEKVKKIGKHYWLGTKLLGKNIKLTVQLLKRLSKGHSLSRRERSLLVQTTADILRLVPFIIIMAVPFLEFALPFLLKLFPNLLPSTYEWKNEQEESKTNKLKGNISMAKFLQETLSEISVELKNKDIVKSKEFADFMTKVKNGVPVSGNEIMTFSQLFRDEITMEKITRPQLLAMHKYLAGGSFVAKWYSSDYLKQQINKKLKKIKQDDILIKKEGLDSLTLEELVDAAIVRGFKVEGYTRKQIELQLDQWLDLSLNKSVPSSLLILSRAFTLTSTTTATEALEDTLEHIPQEALDEVAKKLPVGVFEEGSVERAEEKLVELSKEAEQLEKEEQQADLVEGSADSAKEAKDVTSEMAKAEEIKQTSTATTTPNLLDNQIKELVDKIDHNIKEIETIEHPETKQNESNNSEKKTEQSLSDDDESVIHKNNNNTQNTLEQQSQPQEVVQQQQQQQHSKP